MEKSKKETAGYLEEIKEAYDFMVKNNLDIIEFSSGNDHIKLVRKSANSQNIHILPTMAAPQQVQNFQPSATPSKPATEQINGLTIKAPMSGIFYRASSPSSPPYVREGDIVEANSVVCLVEAMKVFNEIKTEFKCKILKCVAENGKFVNEGDNLFIVEKV
ncbi:MAG: acetyl-CoA carboxylase, biotin carboxyl carrier protein [Elusimicrobiota bacterium]